VVIASLGFESGVTYLVSQSRWSPRQAFAATQLISLTAGIAGAALAYLVYELVPGAFSGLDRTDMLITVAALPFALAWMLGCAVPLALDRYEAHAAPIAGQALLGFVITVPAALLYDLRGAIIAWTAAHALVAIAYGFYMWPRLPHTESHTKALQEALHFGSQTYVNNVLQFLNLRADIFILTAFVGASAQVGQYAVAATVVTTLWMIPWAVSTVLLPRVAALSGEEEHEQTTAVEGKALKHTVLVMLVSCLALIPLLVVGLPLVYGEDFKPAATLAILLLPGVACLGIGSVLISATSGRGRPRYAMINGLITTPLAIVLYVILINADGATGAAIASSLTYATSFILAAFFYRRTTGASLTIMLPTRTELHDYRIAAGDLRRHLA
jgi:O-antigen/teichoic acid export membrane protein